MSWSRSREQCKIFFSKARKCLGLDVIHQGISDGVMPMNDANGGRSDTDDACAAEMDSAICSTHSCSKIDGDVSQSAANVSSECCAHAASTVLQAENDGSSEQDVMGGAMEEEEGKIGKQLSVLHDNKISEGDNPQSVITLKGNAGTALRCNESTQRHEALGYVDAEMKMGQSVVSPVEPVFAACMEIESKSHNDDVIQQKDNGENFSADVSNKEDVPLLVPGTRVRKKQQMDVDIGASNSGTICSAFDSKADAFLPGRKGDDCPRSPFAPDYNHQMPLNLLPCLQNMTQGISLKQENPHSVPLSSVLPDAPTCFGGPHHVASQAMNFEEHGNRWQQYMMRNPSLSQVDHPLHILRGYPLQVLSQEVKREADPPMSEKPVFMESHPKKNEVSQSNQFFISEMHSNHGKDSNISP